ncbi:MAG: glycosyltransferase [Burkholderiales bacterium]|nr:MAG: glycosyltransferase [Burkholderiales bacterium]
MRVLVAHNAYQQRGGEDSVVDDEIALLRSRGVEVLPMQLHNDDIAGMGRIELVGRTIWSRPAAQQLREHCRAFRPDVVHVHNSFPLMSPAIHWAAQEAGVPVVQTLHNFRLLCPQAMLLREKRVCEDCVGHVPWRGAVRGCYRGSVVQSTVLVGMLMTHRALGTWHRRVNRFIALTDFARRKFVEGGLPSERILVKPNFADLPAASEVPRRGLLFVGRLSHEKGIEALAAASAGLAEPVRVIGDGPLRDVVNHAPGLRSEGAQPLEAVAASMRSAAALVLPSICYENFPRTLVEAYASGLPVIASRLGAMAELVQDGLTGLLFEPGDSVALHKCMRWAQEHPQDLAAMGQRARAVHEARYTADCNYAQLMTIYQEAIDEGPRRD